MVPGPRMMVLMLVPAAIAVILLITLSRMNLPGHRWRAVWLIPLAVVVHVVADYFRGRQSDTAITNRSEAVVVLVILSAALWSNREALASWLPRLALVGVLGGAALHALATLIYGYMPVLKGATVVAGFSVSPGLNPDPRYVYADDLGWLAIVLSDFLPIPDGFKVLSLGDLLMLPGAAIALALYLLTLRASTTPDIEAARR